MISTLAKVTGCSTRRQNLFTCCFHLQPVQTLFQSAAIRYDTCLWYHNIMLSREFFVHSLRTTLARGILFPSTWPDWPGGFISGAFLPSPFFSSLFRCWRLLYHFWKIFANSFFFLWILLSFFFHLLDVRGVPMKDNTFTGLHHMV